jgi:hypothetical protein
MGQITIKIPNPKYRLYWCLIEFVDWEYSQYVGIFDPSCEGIRICGEHLQGLYMYFPNLQNCFTAPNKNLGGEEPQTDKHLPPNPFSSQFLRKEDL